MFTAITSCMFFTEDAAATTINIGPFFFLLTVGAVFWIFVRKIKRSVRADDFEYLSVREQLAVANETAETISELEELSTDMQESERDDVMMLHVEWIGRDGEKHAVVLACDGMNTCTEAMTEICESEINSLKNALAHQCAVLSGDIRHRRNSRKNERAQGEGLNIAEKVSALRTHYLNG